jgi:hypothetical protein
MPHSKTSGAHDHESCNDNDGYSELEALAGFDPSKQPFKGKSAKNNSKWLEEIKDSIRKREQE